MGKTKAKIQPGKRGYLVWQWKNKHRTVKVPRWLAMRYREHIGVDWAAVLVRAMPPSHDRALLLIRLAMIREGFIQIRTVMRDPDQIASTSEDFDDDDDFVDRYRVWRRTADALEVQAVELLAKGFNFREIEIEIRVRQGVGKGRRLVNNGLEVYCEIHRAETA